MLSRRLVLPAGEVAALCARLGLLTPPGFDAAPSAITTAGLLVDDEVHPSVAAGLAATCSPQLGVLLQSRIATAVFGMRGDLGGSLVRALDASSIVEVAAWPAERLGPELARAVPAGVAGDVRITVVAPPRVVGQVVWRMTDGPLDPADIGAAVSPLVATALA